MTQADRELGIYESTREEIDEMKETLILRGQTFDSARVIQERYGLSAMSLVRWCRSGFLPKPIRLGRLRYYPREEIDACLARGVEE